MTSSTEKCLQRMSGDCETISTSLRPVWWFPRPVRKDTLLKHRRSQGWRWNCCRFSSGSSNLLSSLFQLFEQTPTHCILKSSGTFGSRTRTYLFLVLWFLPICQKNPKMQKWQFKARSSRVHFARSWSCVSQLRIKPKLKSCLSALAVSRHRCAAGGVPHSQDTHQLLWILPGTMFFSSKIKNHRYR